MSSMLGLREGESTHCIWMHTWYVVTAHFSWRCEWTNCISTSVNMYMYTYIHNCIVVHTVPGHSQLERSMKPTYSRLQNLITGWPHYCNWQCVAFVTGEHHKFYVMHLTLYITQTHVHLYVQTTVHHTCTNVHSQHFVYDGSVDCTSWQCWTFLTLHG